MNNRWFWRGIFVLCLVCLVFQIYGLKRSYEESAKNEREWQKIKQEMDMSQKEWEKHYKK